jgi:hypothetical protein
MTKVYKEAEIQKSIAEKSRVTIERKNIIRIEDESSSSLSMYSLDSNNEYSKVPSHRSPTFILQDAPLPMHSEEVHNSPVTEKVLFERHSVIQE